LLVWLVAAVILKGALSEEWLPVSGDLLNDETLVVWGVLGVLAFLFGSLIVWWSKWVEAKLFGAGRDIELVS